MKKLRLGVVGVGHIGELHTQKYAAMDDVDLVGIADLDRKKAIDIAHKYKTKAYDNYAKLLPHVDAISLAVPTVSHFEVACKILNHGKHLLVEKPITFTIRDAEILVEMAKRNKLILQTGHIERFNPAVIKMESLIENPIYIESQRLNLFSNRGTDVDVVLDLMIHDLDIILNIVDSNIEDIDAVGLSAKSNFIDVANARISFSNGIIANVAASRLSHESIRTIRVFQPKNFLSVDYSKRKIRVTQIIDDRENFSDLSPLVYSEESFPDSDPMADQTKSFVEAVRFGKVPKVSGVDGKKAITVAISIIDQIKGKNFQSLSKKNYQYMSKVE